MNKVLDNLDKCRANAALQLRLIKKYLKERARSREIEGVLMGYKGNGRLSLIAGRLRDKSSL